MFVISEIGSLVNISMSNGVGIDVTEFGTREIIADFGSKDNTYTLATVTSEKEALNLMRELTLMISSCKNVNAVIDIRALM